MSDSTTLRLPAGFNAMVTNIGIKDQTKDFVLVAADRPATCAAVFTQSRFAGPSVVVSRSHSANHQARAVVVISKNANVATGDEGLRNAAEVVAGVAAAIGCGDDEVLIASTGVIGRHYPMDRVRRGLEQIRYPFADDAQADADAVAEGIMTTDTVRKAASATVAGSAASVVGVAKGVGMIEPNMATLISLGVHRCRHRRSDAR